MPNLILPGAQKSASTFLSSWLNRHSEIYIPGRESKVFEDPEYDAFNMQSIDLKTDKRIFGLRRPAYLAKSEIALRIKKHLPDVKFIVVIRNPVDRAISSYYHYMRYGLIPVKGPGFMESIFNGTYDNTFGAYKNIIEYGLYHKHLKSYFELFGKASFLVFLKEEVIGGSPARFWERISKFLDIEYECIERPSVRPQANIYNTSRLKVLSIQNSLKYRYDVNRVKSYPINYNDRSTWGKFLGSTISKLDKYIVRRVFNKPDRLPPGLRAKLLDYYYEDITALENLLSLNLSNWKQLEKPN